MAEYENPDVTVVSSKGQVVIPLAIRRKLGIGPKTKLLVYGYDNVVIMKKLEIPDVVKELEGIYDRIGSAISKYGEISDAEIEAVIQEYRRRKKGPS